MGISKEETLAEKGEEEKEIEESRKAEREESKSKVSKDGSDLLALK